MRDLLAGLTGMAELCELVRKTTKMKQLKDAIEDTLNLLEDVFIYVIEHEANGGGGSYVLYCPAGSKRNGRCEASVTPGLRHEQPRYSPGTSELFQEAAKNL